MGIKVKSNAKLLSPYLKWEAWVDTCKANKAYPIPCCQNLTEALEFHKFDLALVCVPHYLHYSTTLEIAKHNIDVIKEKPLACSSEELDSYTNILKNSKRLKHLKISSKISLRFNSVIN